MPAEAELGESGVVRLSGAWRAALWQVAAAWVVLVFLFLADWRAMALQWWDISTYNHVLLVPPIVVWLVAQRRDELLRLNPAAWWPALVAFGGAAFLWLLGQFAGLALAREVAVVVMAQAAVAAIVGPQVVAGLLFPLFYLLFLVPVGGEIVPILQTITARLTMLLLGLAQIPATNSGVFITTHAGYFEVAEACSGVKFLIAMIAYGALVANVCFVQWRRRVAFMAVAVVVPVLANGVRAFGTIVVAGWFGIRYASGFDHLVYGWVFFALVMALCMAAGWWFFDRAIDTPMVDPAAIAVNRQVRWLARAGGTPRVVLPAMLMIAAGFLGWGQASAMLDAKLPPGMHLPDIAGWNLVPADDRNGWTPLRGGSNQQFRLRFHNGHGQTVDVSFATYANQGEAQQASGFGQGAIPQAGAWAWEKPGPAFGVAKSDLIEVPGDGPNPERRLCLTWYRSGPLLSGSSLELRLHVMANHLLLRREVTAVLILSASNRLNRDPAAAITSFMAATGPVDRWIDHMVLGRD